MMKLFYIASLCIAYILTCIDARGQNYVIKTFTIEDGLPQTQVDDICQDSYGYLWVATRGGGLGRFDGTSFTTYKTKDGLPSNLISNIIWSKDKKLWIGSYEGLTVFDGKTFKNIKLQEDNSLNGVTSLAEDAEGNIWAATLKGGVYKILNEGAGIVYYGAKGGFTDQVVRKIIVDPIEKKIWFSTVKAGLIYKEKNSFQTYSHRDINEIPPIFTVYNDGKKMLFGTRGGLYAENQFTHRIEKVAGVNKHMVFDIKKDASGTLWLGTDTGIIKINKDVIEILDHKVGIIPVPVTTIFEDSEGIIWFSGDNLKSSSTMQFKKIDGSEGLPQTTVMSINFDKNENLWLGFMGGNVSKFSKSEQNVSNFNLSESIVCGIVDNEGIPWFGTSSGIYKKRKNRFIHYNLQNLNPRPIYESVFKDKDGNIWWGGLSNVMHYKDGIFKNYLLPPSEKCVVRGFAQLSTGEILIGASTGLFKYENEAIVKIENPEISGQSIMNILEDEQGMIWMGLYGDGLMRWNRKDNSVKIYREEDGLTSNLIYCMIFDNMNRLWVGSEKGVDFIKFDKSYNIVHVKNFGKPEGFMGIETNHNAITKDRTGNIWIGTVKGVYTFNPEHININATPPQLSIKQIKLYHEVPDWNKFANISDNWTAIPDYIEVPYHKNHFTFIFQAIHFQNPLKVYYSYKLKNFDTKWSPASELKEAVYANLPPGEYTFMVRAKNEDGIWNDRPVEYSFSIIRPIWMRWWFYLVLIGAFLLFAKLLYNYLLQQKLSRILTIEKIKTEEAEKVRKIVAKDFHDEMGNHLASISILVQVLKKKATPLSFELEEIVNKIDKSSRTLFSGTKNFIWSIDPKNDKLYEMLLYIKDFGEDLFDNTGVNFYMDITHLSNNCIKLPPGWSRHIVLITKEALTNCLKHACCKNVWVFIKLEGLTYKITIKDDGRGFNMETLKIRDKNNHIGLENMKFRASKIQCRLGIKKGDNAGTELVLNGDIL